MDESAQYGCGCLIGLVLTAVLFYFIGGTWRTEVTYTPPGVANVSTTSSFKEDLNARHWLVGMVKGEQPDIQKVISKHLSEGKKLTRLTIVTKHTFVDSILVIVTLGIYAPVTVTVEGTVATVI